MGTGPARSAGPVQGIAVQRLVRPPYRATFLATFFVTRVAALLELFVAFFAAGFLGETFFLATRFTSSHRFSSQLHRHPTPES
jgi:hypothetical protein